MAMSPARRCQTEMTIEKMMQNWAEGGRMQQKKNCHVLMAFGPLCRRRRHVQFFLSGF